MSIPRGNQYQYHLRIAKQKCLYQPIPTLGSLEFEVNYFFVLRVNG